MIFKESKTTDILFDLFKSFLSLLDKFFPKDDKILLFPIRDKDDFKDNMRFCYESVRESSKFNCVLLCYSKDSFNHKRFISFHSFQGILYWMRARSIFIHHGTGDIPYFDSIDFHRRKLINLWHGIPLKGIGFTDSKADVGKLKKEFKLYTGVICSSKLDQLAMKSSFGLPNEKIWITGLPRNDSLIQETNTLPNDLIKELEWIQEKVGDKQMILYMPTWRQNSSNDIFSKEECAKLNQFLNDNNAVLALKNHPNTEPFNFRGIDIIDISNSPCKEVSVLLRNADILVTDYSSVWVDYLLLDRPIVSYCYDFDSYKEDPGFIYDYENIFPEKINLTFESFLSNLEKSLEKGSISEKQKRLKHLFHENLDGKNSERIYAKLVGN